MKKSILLILLAFPLFFGCKKDDSPTATEDNSYTINGIHDVDLSATGGNILPVSVLQSANVTQRNVTISVKDLPAGVTATIEPANGIPTFASLITFTTNLSAPAGTYPIKIVGTSNAGTKEYKLNLILPSANGWAIGGKAYNVSMIGLDTGTAMNPSPKITARSNDYQTSVLDVVFNSGLIVPPAGTYKVVDYANANDEVGIRCNVGSQYSGSTKESKTLVLKYDNGKISITASDLTVSEASLGKLSINLKQP